MKRTAAYILGALAILAVLALNNQPNTPNAPAPPAGYQSQWGGSAQVYADIAAETDCAALQETFDRSADNNDRAEPGTAEHRWTTGYMIAADERMEMIGCYR